MDPSEAYLSPQMHLKNLTLLGFKSFADRTSLDFLPGITAIVGPNGCGKSNIADAIRWVLGEQSAKALRGGEMADVIFNGTDRRKQLGLAEVSLTLGGVDQENLKAAGVELSYDEITITRRVCRDGTSDYFINKTPCRLKDIQQLFAGTGVGRASYSIMAQGNITQVLSSKPEDRRAIFEEAAGITRFKAQKREALRKLELTEQNLLRVADLIREVKRQIISLQRQAGKARRYRQYAAELQHLETQYARHQYDVLQAEIATRQARWEHLRGRIEDTTCRILDAETQLAELRSLAAELEREISSVQQQDLGLKAEAEQHASRIRFNEERLREFAAQQTTAQDDIARAEERRLASEQELTDVSAQVTASATHLAELRAVLEQRQQALAHIEAALRQRLDEAQRLQTTLFAEAQRLARTRNELAALDLQKQAALARLEKLSGEKAQLEEERARLENRLAEFEQTSQAQQQDLDARRLGVEERQARLREVQAQLARLGQELEALHRTLADRQSRRQVLAQLEANREGFSAGAQAALQSAHGVLGTLADRLRVPDAHVTAVEAALGHHLQVVLTGDPEQAHQILADLAAGGKGRASVASLNLRNGHVSAAELEPAVAERLRAHQCQPLLGVVEVESSVTALVHGLLGRTQLVPDLAAATAAWAELPGQFDFVTPAGDLLSRHGVFTGGRANGCGGAAASILARKNEIAALDAELAGLQTRLETLNRDKGALQGEQTVLQAGLQEAQSELRAQEVALATRQGEHKALTHARQVLHQKIDTVVFEIQSLAGQQQEAETRRTELTHQLAELEAREAALQRELAGHTAAIEQERQRREEAHAALTEARVAVAAEEQRNTALRQQQRPLEQRIRELLQLVEQRRRDLDGLFERRRRAEAEINESRLRGEALAQEREHLGRRLADLENQRAVHAAELAAREEALRALRRELDGLQEQRGAEEVALAERRLSLQNLCERIQQKYQVRLEDVQSECIRITFADEGPAKVVVVTPEEMAQAGVATDWEAVAAQIATLQQRIDEMGPVNLVAIEEFEEAEQRHQHLAAQHDDLVEAQRQLVEVINRVNAQTREMFTDTFQRIRENFRSLFEEIFGGGTADLHLVDEGDVLESGIEILARPPGKQLRSISLLSGGEQTMTAVALLFAIYMVRPSPFCVLDELDAPLDESNINRFVQILQRFVKDSQFLIITHNKRTIAMADVLYGITMQEHGVSKVVSVKFRRASDTPEVAAPEAPAPEETTVGGTDLSVLADAASAA
jgi:chromosome segregation protein